MTIREARTPPPFWILWNFQNIHAARQTRISTVRNATAPSPSTAMGRAETRTASSRFRIEVEVVCMLISTSSPSKVDIPSKNICHPLWTWHALLNEYGYAIRPSAACSKCYDTKRAHFIMWRRFRPARNALAFSSTPVKHIITWMFKPAPDLVPAVDGRTHSPSRIHPATRPIFRLSVVHFRARRPLG
ncbi:hypothetical protein BD626DRAFT_255329 [Schizophyllum amplum]|uniref:Uncharacterized protein n=1 Tax=Schizophyllum amplum TaxID=97359 RepID=A0A550CIH2_9AGAR|nr:hypothetical protein BD626DRAFT_255329 [Auriculariopsis ampla]